MSLLTWVNISTFVFSPPACLGTSLWACHTVSYTVGAQYVFLGLSWINAEGIHRGVLIFSVTFSLVSLAQVVLPELPSALVSLGDGCSAQGRGRLRAWEVRGGRRPQKQLEELGRCWESLSIPRGATCAQQVCIRWRGHCRPPESSCISTGAPQWGTDFKFNLLEPH